MASSEELEFPIRIDLDGEDSSARWNLCDNLPEPQGESRPASASFLSQSLRSACFNTSCAEASEAKSNWPATHGALAQPFQVLKTGYRMGIFANMC